MTSPEQPSEPSGEIRVWVPFLVLAIAYLMANLFGLPVLALAERANHSIDAAHPPDWFVLTLTTVLDVMLVVGAWIALGLVRGRARPEDLGLRRVANVRRALLVGVTVAVVFWIVALLLAKIFGNPPDEELVKKLKAQDSWVALGAFAVLTCVLAPIAEELFFRGFMYNAFAHRFGPRWGALLGGAVFGLVHAPNPPVTLAALGVLGVGLCVLYWRTQSIIPCMALHALNNSVAFGSTKSLHWEAFAGLALVSVGLVVAMATAVAARPAVAV
jgi:membrane protease YdiL (CAAX protease family)